MSYVNAIGLLNSHLSALSSLNVELTEIKSKSKLALAKNEDQINLIKRIITDMHIETNEVGQQTYINQSDTSTYCDIVIKPDSKDAGVNCEEVKIQDVIKTESISIQCDLITSPKKLKRKRSNSVIKQANEIKSPKSMKNEDIPNEPTVNNNLNNNDLEDSNKTLIDGLYTRDDIIYYIKTYKNKFAEFLTTYGVKLENVLSTPKDNSFLFNQPFKNTEKDTIRPSELNVENDLYGDLDSEYPSCHNAKLVSSNNSDNTLFQSINKFQNNPDTEIKPEKRLKSVTHHSKQGFSPTSHDRDETLKITLANFINKESSKTSIPTSECKVKSNSLNQISTQPKAANENQKSKSNSTIQSTKLLYHLDDHSFTPIKKCNKDINENRADLISDKSRSNELIHKSIIKPNDLSMKIKITNKNTVNSQNNDVILEPKRIHKSKKSKRKHTDKELEDGEID